MNTINDTKKIYLTPSGAYKKDTLFSNLNFNIPSLFPKDNFTLYNTIKVLHCEIPYSFYLVNNYNSRGLYERVAPINLP
jgi:hypothetical protein